MKEKKLFFSKNAACSTNDSSSRSQYGKPAGILRGEGSRKIEGEVEEQKINDTLKTEYLAVGCITVVMAIARVITRL